jgi:hypothetical protein
MGTDVSAHPLLPTITTNNQKENAMNTPIKLSKTEEINVLKAEVMTLKLQMRTLLHSHQSCITQMIELAEVVKDVVDDQADLASKYRALLLKESVQLVLDSMDDDQPTFADVWEVDEYFLDEPLHLRTEQVVL